MKKILVLFIFAISLSATAQSLRFIYNDEQLENNDTILYYYTADDFYLTKPQLGFVNTSESSASFQMGVAEQSISPDHVLAFCVNGDCFGLDATPVIELTAAEEVTERDPRAFHFNFEINGTGETMVKMYARNQSDPNDETFFYVRYCYSASLADVKEESKLNAYPNPATSEFTLAYNPQWAAHGGKVVIRNILGSVVYQSELSTNGKMKISTEHIKAGVYFYSIEDNAKNLISTRKLIIK